MACACKAEGRKVVGIGQPGGANLVAIAVTIESECTHGNDDDAVKLLQSPAGQLFLVSSRFQQDADYPGYKPGVSPEPYSGKQEAKANAGNCFIQYDVTLEINSSPGLMITEVQLGEEIFAANIGRGQTLRIISVCEESCATVRTGSVKVVDAAGNPVATLKRINICECGAFA